MKSPYETYVLGLRLSHRALVRNLDRFAALSHDRARPSDDVAAFVRLYVEFLDVHHASEDRFVIPALRHHGAGRTTDVAHLDRWTAEHRDIEHLGAELGKGGAAFAAHARELRALVVPHTASEEAVLTADHLREMIPAAELGELMDAIAKSNRRRALDLASFLATSLEPAEQHELLGDAPWLFRRVLLPIVGGRKMRRFRDLVHTPRIAP